LRDEGTAVKQLRIFVCSTFRDMQEEREELVKKVYPQLKHFCMQRGVSLSVIDLRWGITAEQTEMEQVIPICLREVELCRPYFVCLLGERYGWVPPRIPSALLAEFPWLRYGAGMSLTEMEIRHGALNHPGAASAFFYLRDPRYVAPSLRDAADSRELDPERAARLAALKVEIRASRGRVVDDYTSPRDAAQQLRLDLEQIIEARSPVNPLVQRRRTIHWQENLGDPHGPRGTPLQTFEELRLKEQMFSGSLLTFFAERTEPLRRLNAFAAGPESLLVLAAPEGGGKSTLLAHWSSRYASAHPDVAVVARYIGHPTTRVGQALQRAAWDLSERYRLGRKVDLAGLGAPLLLDVLREASTRGQVVLVIDGLDHARSDRDLELNWLTSPLPQGVTVICSARPGTVVDMLRQRGARIEELPGLTHDERRDMVQRYLTLHGKSLTESQLSRLIAQRQTDNPLFLRTLLDELRVFGRFEQLDATIDRYAAARGEPELYDAVLTRLEADFGDRPGELVASMFRCMLCARTRSLLEEDLAGVLGLAPLYWSELHYAVRDLLVTRDFRLAFRDDDLAAAAASRYLAAEEIRTATHLRLANYFRSHPASSDRGDDVAYQLFRAGAWDRLRDWLVDETAQVIAYTPDDLLEYWTALKERYDPQAEYLAAIDRVAPGNPLGMPHFLPVAEFLEIAGFRRASEQMLEKIASATAGTHDLTATTALNNLAILLNKDGRWPEAMAAARRSLVLSDEAYPRLILGIIELSQGSYDKAKRTLALALSKAENATYRDEQLIETVLLAMARSREALGEDVSAAARRVT
jgi:nephrocystin-3